MILRWNIAHFTIIFLQKTMQNLKQIKYYQKRGAGKNPCEYMVNWTLCKSTLNFLTNIFLRKREEGPHKVLKRKLKKLNKMYCMLHFGHPGTQTTQPISNLFSHTSWHYISFKANTSGLVYQLVQIYAKKFLRLWRKYDLDTFFLVYK